MLRVFKRFIPITEGYRGSRYLVREQRRMAGTPLLAVLLLITVSDVIFAVDSIPAVFAVTQNAFVAFVLSGAVERFRYLKVSLAAVLGFVGVKLALHQVVRVPTGLSLAVIALLFGAGIAASWIRRRRAEPSTTSPDPESSPPARLEAG